VSAGRAVSAGPAVSAELAVSAGGCRSSAGLEQADATMIRALRKNVGTGAGKLELIM
jgi:hypothetical protein